MSGQGSSLFAQPLSERARWRVLLLILCWPIIQSFLAVARGHAFGLPGNMRQLVVFLLLEFLVWGTVFIVGFRTSGITASQLRVKVSHPLRTIGFGIVWFFAIRISTLVLLLAVSHWFDPTEFWSTEEKVASFMNAMNIAQHPLFSFTVFGLVSLIAGFTEELWRAGMLAGIKALFPRIRAVPSILGVSTLFGLGHIYEGGFGVVNAMIIGTLLGLVLVYRNSYWEPAIAHTLIDALAFAAAALLLLNAHTFNALVVYGAQNGDLHRVKHWVAMGGDVNAAYDAGKDWKNITALETAADRPEPDVVRFLLEKGANPNVADSKGLTPLIAAAEQNQLPNVRLLLAHGAKLNALDRRGFTALRVAAEYNRVEIVRALIDAGADVNMRDYEGESALAAATKYRYEDLMKLLQQNGGK